MGTPVRESVLSATVCLCIHQHIVVGSASQLADHRWLPVWSSINTVKGLAVCRCCNYMVQVVCAQAPLAVTLFFFFSLFSLLKNCEVTCVQTRHLINTRYVLCVHWNGNRVFFIKTKLYCSADLSCNLQMLMQHIEINKFRLILIRTAYVHIYL